VTEPQTLTQKVFARAAGRSHVAVGEEVRVHPDRIMSYEWPGYISKYVGLLRERTGTDAVVDPDRYIVFIDHLVTRGDAEELERRRETLEWAQRAGIHLHDRVGIGHQVAAELGYAVPGTLVVHIDPHVSGLGPFGTIGVGLHHMLMEAWMTEHVVLPVPGTVRVELSGELPDQVDGRDVIHHMIRDCGADGLLGMVVEFVGPGIGSLHLADRQSLCGQILFTGAESAVMETDKLALDFVAEAVGRAVEPVAGDSDATVERTIELDLGDVSPIVALPGNSTADHMAPIDAVVGTPLQRGFIGSCSSGRYEDLEAAAALLDGRHVAPGFELIIVPTSNAIRDRAERSGVLATLEAAGARIAGSSCDHCFGYADPLRDGESCISSGVLNVRGRMGAVQSEIFLASANTVAASALVGAIADPREVAEVAR
jgi:3-isopropylmalate/(R)-2-methylmalate dehydratase large subunit